MARWLLVGRDFPVGYRLVKTCENSTLPMKHFKKIGEALPPIGEALNPEMLQQRNEWFQIVISYFAEAMSSYMTSYIRQIESHEWRIMWVVRFHITSRKILLIHRKCFIYDSNIICPAWMQFESSWTTDKAHTSLAYCAEVGYCNNLDDDQTIFQKNFIFQPQFFRGICKFSGKYIFKLTFGPFQIGRFCWLDICTARNFWVTKGFLVPFCCARKWCFFKNLSMCFANQITPRKLTWNLRIHPWKRKIIFQTIIFRFYVNLRGCKSFWASHILQSMWHTWAVQTLFLECMWREWKNCPS